MFQVQLQGANLQGANLAGAQLKGAKLVGANLALANLDSAWLIAQQSGNVRTTAALEQLEAAVASEAFMFIDADAETAFAHPPNVVASTEDN